MKIEDNFLEQKDFDELQTLMMGDDFVWYYGDGIDYGKELNKFQKKIVIEEGYIHPTVLVNMWANITPPGCSNRMHNHPHSQWSGVYYVKTPKDCGNLVMEDPREGYAMTAPKQISADKLPRRLLRNVAYIPVAGRLIMFPGFLSHYVDVNKSKENRITISFNFIQMVSYRTGKIEQ